MILKFIVFVCIMCVGVILTGSRPSLAAPNVVPKLNVRPSCESPARRIVANGRAKGPETCIKKERGAHELLIKNWFGYVTADKTPPRHHFDGPRGGSLLTFYCSAGGWKWPVTSASHFGPRPLLVEPDIAIGIDQSRMTVQRG
jgi:hypothetical protein